MNTLITWANQAQYVKGLALFLLMGLFANALTANDSIMDQSAFEQLLKEEAIIESYSSDQNSDLILQEAILNEEASKSDTDATSIEGIVGTIPTKILWVIEQLKSPEGIQPGFKNRMILHGPPGNGKTTLASKIADAAGAMCIKLHAPSAVTRYQGSGAENIEEIFKQAEDFILYGECKVVVFIDEVDAIAANTDGETRGDQKAAIQKLWLELDKYKDNPNIFIIVATNELKKLHKTFLDRFGNNVIELKNPDEELRKKVLEYYFAKFSVARNPELMKQLVKKSKDLSIRALEDFAGEISMATKLNKSKELSQKEMLATLENMKKNRTGMTDEEWRKKLEKIQLYLSIAGGFFGVMYGLEHYGLKLIGKDGLKLIGKAAFPLNLQNKY
jgi:AAA+ superfamily predicted ATPase